MTSKIRNPNDEIRWKPEGRSPEFKTIHVNLHASSQQVTFDSAWRIINIRISFGFRHSDFGFLSLLASVSRCAHALRTAGPAKVLNKSWASALTSKVTASSTRPISNNAFK